MSQSAAAVIDLQEFRRKKEQGRETQQQDATPRLVVFPVWVCWVPMPMWPIG